VRMDGVINISGVDFWHAVEFSRNGRFLRTHPQNILWGFPPGASLRCFQLSRSDFRFRHPLERAAGPFFRFRVFPFRRFRLYQILSGLIPSQRGLSFRPPGRSDE
jgi:hypothetical protein